MKLTDTIYVEIDSLKNLTIIEYSSTTKSRGGTDKSLYDKLICFMTNDEIDTLSKTCPSLENLNECTTFFENKIFDKVKKRIEEFNSEIKEIKASWVQWTRATSYVDSFQKYVDETTLTISDVTNYHKICFRDQLATERSFIYKMDLIKDTEKVEFAKDLIQMIKHYGEKYDAFLLDQIHPYENEDILYSFIYNICKSYVFTSENVKFQDIKQNVDTLLTKIKTIKNNVKKEDKDPFYEDIRQYYLSVTSSSKSSSQALISPTESSKTRRSSKSSNDSRMSEQPRTITALPSITLPVTGTFTIDDKLLKTNLLDIARFPVSRSSSQRALALTGHMSPSTYTLKDFMTGIGQTFQDLQSKNKELEHERTCPGILYKQTLAKEEYLLQSYEDQHALDSYFSKFADLIEFFKEKGIETPEIYSHKYIHRDKYELFMIKKEDYDPIGRLVLLGYCCIDGGRYAVAKNDQSSSSSFSHSSYPPPAPTFIQKLQNMFTRKKGGLNCYSIKSQKKKFNKRVNYCNN